MRAGTLSRTRIFRADPELDAAVAAGAARAGVPVSAYLRALLRDAVASSPRPIGSMPSTSASHSAGCR